MRKTNQKKERNIRSLFTGMEFFVFMLLIMITTAISFSLFFTFSDMDWHQLSWKSIVFTCGNTTFMAMWVAIGYGIWHKFRVERPVNRILDATEKITEGDFSVRIQPVHTDRDKYNELDLIIDDFNTMAHELSGTETLRNDFIANVSHEIKTPLAAMQNYATLLQTPGLSEEKRMEYARSITASSRKLSELITNILKLNKLENQQIFPEPVEFNLTEELQECVVSFEQQWEKKNISIDADIEDDVRMEGDPDLLSLVFNNLMSNAIKFTEKDGHIGISLHGIGKEAEIRVRDDGCGMDKETASHVFEKFYQGDSSHAAKGNGLGLALAKRVVDISRGTITVESQPGKGSTFIVRLPLKAESLPDLKS